LNDDNLPSALENHSLKDHNTFGIDAKARYFLAARSEAELRGAFSTDAFKNFRS
jgi:UDP-N-acetylenolpyruvoylglucosamine reductase